MSTPMLKEVKILVGAAKAGPRALASELYARFKRIRLRDGIIAALVAALICIVLFAYVYDWRPGDAGSVAAITKGHSAVAYIDADGLVVSRNGKPWVRETAFDKQLGHHKAVICPFPSGVAILTRTKVALFKDGQQPRDFVSKWAPFAVPECDGNMLFLAERAPKVLRSNLLRFATGGWSVVETQATYATRKGMWFADEGQGAIVSDSGPLVAGLPRGKYTRIVSNADGTLFAGVGSGIHAIEANSGNPWHIAGTGRIFEFDPDGESLWFTRDLDLPIDLHKGRLCRWWPRTGKLITTPANGFPTGRLLFDDDVARAIKALAQMQKQR
jgi:hypothetical protein